MIKLLFTSILATILWLLWLWACFSVLDEVEHVETDTEYIEQYMIDHSEYIND